MPVEPDQRNEVNETRIGPGEKLRQARESQGLAIAQVAAELHLDEVQIEALENEKFEVIGAPVFVRGHLKNYALLLKIDSDQLLENLDTLGTNPNPAAVSTEVELTMQRDRRIRRISMLLGFIVAVVALVYTGLWVVERINNLDGSDQVVIPDIRIPQVTINEPVGDAEDEKPASTALPVQLPSAAGDLEVTEDSTAGEPPVAEAVTTKQLTFRFNSESWVEAYDARGTRLIYEMGMAGSQLTLTGEPPMEIFLGFVDGVEILVDGEPVALQNARRRGNTAQITIERDQ